MYIVHIAQIIELSLVFSSRVWLAVAMWARGKKEAGERRGRKRLPSVITQFSELEVSRITLKFPM